MVSKLVRRMPRSTTAAGNVAQLTNLGSVILLGVSFTSITEIWVWVNSTSSPSILESSLESPSHLFSASPASVRSGFGLLFVGSVCSRLPPFEDCGEDDD